MAGKLGRVSTSVVLMVPMIALVIALLHVSGRAPAVVSHPQPGSPRGDMQEQTPPSNEIRDFPQLG
jgi:hypothetical protein